MLFKLAWRNIFRNRKRSLISISSVTFAVLCAVFMRALQFGAYDNMIGNVVGSYLGYIQIHKKGFWDQKNIDLSFDTDLHLSEVEDVEGLAYRAEGFALASFKERSMPAAVIGLDPAVEKDLIGLDKKLIKGEYLSNAVQGLLIAKNLAVLLQVDVGDSIALLGQGVQGSFAAGIYPVSGVLDLKSPELNRRTLIMNLNLAQEFYAMPEQATTAVVAVHGNNWKQAQSEVIAQTDTTDLEVLNWQQMLPELVQLIRADRAGGTVVLIILYLIIAFGLLGTVLMLTEERSYEYGVLVAIGLEKRKLFLINLLETLMMAAVGVIAGMVLSFPVVAYFHYNPIRLGGEIKQIAERFGFEAVLPTSIDPSIIMSHAGIIFLLVVVVNSYVYLKIRKLKPVEAMKQ